MIKIVTLFLSICFPFTIHNSVEAKPSSSTSFSFVMFAGPFAMIFYGVQIFQETGETNQTGKKRYKY